MKIYIARSGTRYGPYTVGAIRGFLVEGSVTAEDSAWAPGCDDWVELHSLLSTESKSHVSVADPPSEQPPDQSRNGQEHQSRDNDVEPALDYEALKQDLAGRFAGEKAQFLISLERDLRGKIEANGKQNLVLIEKTSAGDRRYSPSTSASYCKRLIAFARRKKYNGNELDVALTAYVVEIVTEHFQQLYQASEGEIADAVAEAMIKNETAARSLIETVVESSAASQASEVVKQQAATLVLNQLRTALQGASVRSIVTGAAKIALTKPAGIIILKTLAVNLKFVVAKVLASAGFKALLLASMKKFLAGALVGYFARLLAVKFGAAALASKTVILIPIVVAFIAWEISRFSKNLGAKVAKKVIEEMSIHYEKINVDVFDRLVTEIFSTGVKTIARDLGQGEALQNSLADLVAAAGR